MKIPFLRGLAATASAAAMALASPAAAGDGHDHGDAPPSASGPAMPRFTASSELFELVGVVNGQQITLYLDHAADNAPVKDAQLEVELGGAKLTIEPHADGEFVATLAQALAPGVIPVTATVTTPKESDLLAGELDLHAAAPAGAVPAPAWRASAGWVGGAGAAAVALAIALTLLARSLLRPRQRTAVAPQGAGSTP